MTEVEFDPSRERPTSMMSRREIREAEQRRLLAEVAEQEHPRSRRELREQFRRRDNDNPWANAFGSAEDNEHPSADQLEAPVERRILSRREARRAAATSDSPSTTSSPTEIPLRARATESRKLAAASSTETVDKAKQAASTEASPAGESKNAAAEPRTSWSLADEFEVEAASSDEKVEPVSKAKTTAENAEVAAPAQPIPASVPESEPSAIRSVLSVNSLFAFDEVEVKEPETAPVSRSIPERPDLAPEQRAASPAAANTADTAPTQILNQRETGPQPRLEDKKPGSEANPEQIRRTRATTLRGKRTATAAPAATHPPTESRRKRGATVVRKLAAGGVLLVAGAFVVATSVPAQAFFGGAGQQGSSVVNADGVDQINAQSVVVPENASQLELMIDGDIGIQDALQSARISQEEIDRIQLIADSSLNRPSGWMQGVDGFEDALPLLETSYVQQPFPQMPDAPISSGFEWRWGKVHEAIDFTPGAGTEIYPMANGIVTNVMPGTTSGGHMVTIDHMIDGKRYQTTYAHMIAGSIQVREGQVVTIDTVIGQVGSTGFSTGPHLHFQIIRADVTPIDPVRWWQDRSEYTAGDISGSY